MPAPSNDGGQAPVPGAAPPTPQVPDPGVQPPQAAPPQPAQSPVPVPAPEKIQISREALDQRLARERSNAKIEALKSMGFESEEKYSEWKASYDQEQEAKRQAELEQMSEIERYKAELSDQKKALEEAEQARNSAIAEAEAARVEAHLNAVFAKNKITNSSYAMFRFEQAIKELPDGQDLDEQAFIDKLLEDPREAVALGVSAPDPVSVPATTTAPKDGPIPTASGNGTTKHASQMTPDEWIAFKRANNIG